MGSLAVITKNIYRQAAVVALIHTLLLCASAFPGIANSPGIHLVGGNIVLGQTPSPISMLTATASSAFQTPQVAVTTVTIYPVINRDQQQTAAAATLATSTTSTLPISTTHIGSSSVTKAAQTPSMTAPSTVPASPSFTVDEFSIHSTPTGDKPTETAMLAQAHYWQQPDDFSPSIDVALGIERWAWGQSLVTVLSKLSAQTSIPPSKTLRPQNTARPSMPPRFQDKHVLQIKYPKGSVNPGNTPQGGIGFYANPLNLTQALNVSFTYSVYFPAFFDFVKGGKLPGLYGGHGGCSGGAESEDCFSTRLMFRSDGQGELYLYVPKGDDSDSGDAQSPELCKTPPASYCDSKYGYSIGRGAWTFFRDRWSDVRQDVWLNTPGSRDGGFNVWINGDLVLHSGTVMYRRQTNKDKHQKESEQANDSKAYMPGTEEGEHPDENGAPLSCGNANPGLLCDGSALASLGNSIDSVLSAGSAAIFPPKMAKIRHAAPPSINESDTARPKGTPNRHRSMSMLAGENDGILMDAQASRHTRRHEQLLVLSSRLKPPMHGWRNQYALHRVGSVHPARIASRATVPTQNAALFTYIDEMHLEGCPNVQEPKEAGKVKAQVTAKPVTFLGIMCDTFFGGNDPSWATPEDQHSYFNSFSLQINS